MSVVGAFPGINAMRRRTIRAEVNPMDKSTIISIYPKKIDEIKHTIEPRRFIIEPGSPEVPSILVVGPASWWKEIDEEQPLLEIPNSSIQVADSIVRDYCNGLLGCNMVDSMPGLFWVPGQFEVVDIKKKFSNLLTKAEENQKRWYSALVKMADTLWAKTNGSAVVIGDDMRMAAKSLGLQNKDWMKDFTMQGQERCPACGTFRNPNYPICSTCKAVLDPTKAKALGIQFAV